MTLDKWKSYTVRAGGLFFCYCFLSHSIRKTPSRYCNW